MGHEVPEDDGDEEATYGMDRLLGYGLKYDDHFQHSHLGIQAPRDGSHAREGALADAGLRALIEDRDGLMEIAPSPPGLTPVPVAARRSIRVRSSA
jgi:Domain of unknown function (DUF4260)